MCMTQPEEIDRMLTTAQVANQLGYSKQGVRRLCERGAFPGALRVLPGGPWRIPESDVRALRDRTRAAVRPRKRGS